MLNTVWEIFLQNLSVMGETLWILCLFSAIFYLLSARFLKKVSVLPKQSINFAPAHDPTSPFVADNKFEFVYPFINNVFTKPFLAVILGFAYKVMAHYLPYQIFSEKIQSWPFVFQVLLALFVIDVALYVRHRFVHEHMWSFHGVHHCAQKITWLTTTRVHPVDVFSMGIINFLILYFIGFSGEGFVVASFINGLWNYFVHMNICLDFPKPLKYILGSPNFHRWHHATEEEAHNKNYCIMFACVDYVMGTYYLPDNRLPQSYGSSLKKLDDISQKTIGGELWYPVGRQIRKLRKMVSSSSPQVAASETSSLSATPESLEPSSPKHP